MNVFLACEKLLVLDGFERNVVMWFALLCEVFLLNGSLQHSPRAEGGVVMFVAGGCLDLQFGGPAQPLTR